MTTERPEDDTFNHGYAEAIRDVFREIQRLNWDVSLEHLADNLGLSEQARKDVGL